jgi:protein-tyrosine-phosphatase/catechol 2,3-dioxygenase-like lactoylglutathione lyase family enzyme
MKRFHVHIHVDDLAKSIAFYSRLFAAEPARVEADYAKWMLDDPRVNFAISTRGDKPGLDHLGFQVDDAAELAQLKARAEAADMALLDEGATSCCYARSEKHWITDPQGIAWEHFHTLGNIPVFNEAGKTTAAGACCAPAPTPEKAAATCCSPASTVTQAACCPPTTVFADTPAVTPAVTPAASAEKSAGCCAATSAASASKPLNVLFICAHNCARSILAEALLNAMAPGRFKAYSAGNQPSANQQPHPLALQMLQKAGISIDGLRSKSWNEFAAPDAPHMDLIITVCDDAAGEVCPVWPGNPSCVHWGYPDPTASTVPQAQRIEAFRTTMHMLHQRLELLINLPSDKLEKAALPSAALELAAH